MVHAAFMLKEAVLVLHLEQEVPTALNNIVIVNRAPAATDMRGAVALKGEQRQRCCGAAILGDRAVLIRTDEAPAAIAHLLLLEPFQTGANGAFGTRGSAIDGQQGFF